MTETDFRKKLLYRSLYRGCKETDLLLGRFAEKYIHDMSLEELEQWNSILDQTDSDIVSWVLGRSEVPASLKNKIMERLVA